MSLLTGEAYDHMMAAVVLGVIFIAAVVVVPALSYVNLLYLDQQQLRNIALSAFKTILFDEGYPGNWGSMHGTSLFNENDVQRFGLALYGDSSFYVLDQYKVQRLANNPMGNISYAKMKELLGLSGYDFSITLRPLFNVDKNVTIDNDGSEATVSFTAEVKRYDEQPVPNAIISTTVVYTVMQSGGQDKFETRIVDMERKYSGSLGRCSGAELITAPQGWDIKDIAVIFRVTVGDRATVTISEQSSPNPDDVAKISLVGDDIIATLDESLPGSNDARWITDITMYNFESSINLYSRGAPWGEPDLQKGERSIWTQNFPWLSSSDPAILIFTFRTEPIGPGGRTFVLVIGPYSLWSQSGVIQSNPVPSSSGAAVSVQRDVIIAGMAYVAELRLWKT